MNRLKIFKTMVLISTVLLSLDALSSEMGPEISLYNIAQGYMPYTYYNSRNEYLGFNSAYQLNTDIYRSRTNWNIVYNSNGTVSFKNVHFPTYCMQWYGTDYVVIQTTCNTIDETQQFNLKLTTTGALLIKFKHNDQCLYDKGGYVASKSCEPQNRYFSWVIIPPLKDPPSSTS